MFDWKSFWVGVLFGFALVVLSFLNYNVGYEHCEIKHSNQVQHEPR